MKPCFACAGTGHSYAVLGGVPTPCRFCPDDPGQRDPCTAFTPANPGSAPYPMRPCGECGHPSYAH